MALISMTGFGRGDAARSGIKVEVELSSVNRKQFDVRINLPRSLSVLESRIYELIHKSVRRGHVQGMVRVGSSGNGNGRRVVVDTGVAGAYVRELRNAASELNLEDDLNVRALLMLPEVVRLEGVSDDAEKVWPLVKKALKSAISELRTMQCREGEALQKDILARLAKLRKRLAQVKKLSPGVVKRYRKLLEERLSKAGVCIGSDSQGLLKEVAVFADRCDISEEITRLESHFDQAEKIIAAKNPAGRPLDFLCQEMFREINTIGSKANNGAIAAQVVFLKTELECVREQVQNVE